MVLGIDEEQRPQRQVERKMLQFLFSDRAEFRLECLSTILIKRKLTTFKSFILIEFE